MRYDEPHLMTTQPDQTPVKSPTLVIFLGGGGRSPVEAMVAAARRSAALDSIEAALASGAFERAILAIDDACAEGLPPGVEVDIDDGPFHFGRRLAGVIERYSLASVIYIGGGRMIAAPHTGVTVQIQPLAGRSVRMPSWYGTSQRDRRTSSRGTSHSQ